MEFRNSYERTEHVGEKFELPSLTQQHFKDECDINNIINHFTRTGEFPVTGGLEPQYGDYSTPIDYQAAMNVVAHAKEQFEALPAKVRAKFDNDPSVMLEFVSKRENIKESVELGLLNTEALELIKDTVVDNTIIDNNKGDNNSVPLEGKQA